MTCEQRLLAYIEHWSKCTPDEFNASQRSNSSLVIARYARVFRRILEAKTFLLRVHHDGDGHAAFSLRSAKRASNKRPRMRRRGFSERRSGSKKLSRINADTMGPSARPASSNSCFLRKVRRPNMSSSVNRWLVALVMSKAAQPNIPSIS